MVPGLPHTTSSRELKSHGYSVRVRRKEHWVKESSKEHCVKRLLTTAQPETLDPQALDAETLNPKPETLIPYTPRRSGQETLEHAQYPGTESGDLRRLETFFLTGSTRDFALARGRETEGV